MGSTKLSRFLLVVFILVFFAGCDSEIGYQPPGIPIRISVDAGGNIKLSTSASLSTPIGTFDLDVGQTLWSLRQSFRNEVLVVRIDNKVTVYKLPKDRSFKVEFVGDDTLYKKVRLETEPDGDIVLELESTAIQPPVTLLNGRWEGAVIQPDFRPYSTELNLTNCKRGNICGSVSYPDLPCSGDITFLNIEGGKYILLERIRTGSTCVEAVYYP